MRDISCLSPPGFCRCRFYTWGFEPDQHWRGWFKKNPAVSLTDSQLFCCKCWGMRDSTVDVMNWFHGFIHIHPIYGKQITLKTFSSFHRSNVPNWLAEISCDVRNISAQTRRLVKASSLTVLTSGVAFAHWEEQRRESAAGACTWFNSCVVHARYV